MERSAFGSPRARKGGDFSARKNECGAQAFHFSSYPMALIQAETERCLAVNAAYLDTFGLRREDMIGGTTFWTSLWPDPKERRRLTERVLSERSVRNIEALLETKEGNRRRFLVTIDLVPLGTRRCFLTTCHDVTALPFSDDALQQRIIALEEQIATHRAALCKSEEWFRTFCDNAPNLVFLKDAHGRYLYVNRRFQSAFRIEEQDILGKTDEQLFPREQASQFQTHDRLVVKSGEPMEFEESATCADGLRTSIVVKFPIQDKSGNIYATGGIATDITDRKRAEEELRRSREELRRHRAQLEDLTAKLITAQDLERQRIARDLHDDVSQQMAVLLLDLTALEQRPPVLPELWIQRIASIREQLEQLSDDLHNLAHKLHPTLLMHVGLQAAVEDLVHRVAARTSLRVLLKIARVPPELPHDQGLCLFRVLQESLQNVVKHARATEATVILVGSAKGVGLSVKDNGKGFDPEEKTVHCKGLGLISMRERLRLMNGFLNIHSRPEEGTKICAWIPFHEGAP
ncbi:MAG: PAS domain-containing protein [Nitrospira sp.]|nr:PAS domain-containing protein [Nitrospira sp.]